MLKQEKLYSLLETKITSLLEGPLTALKFKYSKSARSFSRTEDGFKQFVSFYAESVHWKEKEEELILNASIHFHIEYPAYEKWHVEHFEAPAHIRHNIATIHCKALLDFSDFEEENFYTPSPAVQFKMNIIGSLGPAGQEEKERIEIKSFIQDQLGSYTMRFESDSAVGIIFENRQYPLALNYINLLIYAGQKEKAAAFYDESYQGQLAYLKENESQKDGYFASALIRLDRFIADAALWLGKTYTNPYQTGVSVSPSQEKEIQFTGQYRFKESLRLSAPFMPIKESVINSRTGEVLVYLDNDTLIKFNEKGEKLTGLSPDWPTGYSASYHRQIGCIEETGVFFAGNFFITKENIVVRLPVAVASSKKKKADTGNDLILKSADYSVATKKYYVLLFKNQKKTCFYNVYTENFELQSSVELDGFPKGVVPVKEWAITSDRKKENYFWDIQGNKVHTLEFANGNNDYAISASGRYFMSFFYSTKSQFYDLETGKQKPLWAHPTFITGYKEKFYNDINHNFGLSIARFSPDETYIVGCADHGKYVAWKMPSLERIELIPKPEVFPFLGKAEVVQLEGQTFLKNRGPGVQDIYFLNNGDYFIFQMNTMVLVWNRNFENIGLITNAGKIRLYDENYLGQLTSEELIIYKHA